MYSGPAQFGIFLALRHSLMEPVSRIVSSNPGATLVSAEPAKPVVATSVREMVEFILRTGDLGGSGHFSGVNRALEGTRGHQRLQRSRPHAYEAEVSINWQCEQPGFSFLLRGRIDGVLVSQGNLLIEEIKTTRRLWSGPVDSLHLAQGKVYAFLYAREHGFDRAEVQITYLDLESSLTTEFRKEYSLAELEEFFQAVIQEYLQWISDHQHWLQRRNESIRELNFPFSYRPGQRALAVAAYRTVHSGARLYAEAPTGIGKTISVLFPTIKSMGQGKVEKLFYLTAKTIGRTVAEETLRLLRERGLQFRSVTLTARDKICFNQGQPCDVKTCRFALGYYDRLKPALRSALAQREGFTRNDLETIAREHMVCPFELSLDLSLWVDAIICDYNYVFDPSVSLKRYFSDDRNDFALLVDEAHNLPDRAREMFSAELNYAACLELAQTLRDALPSCAKALRQLTTRLKSLSAEEGWIPRENAFVRQAAPVEISRSLETFLEAAESWLVQETPAPFRQDLLEAYFSVTGFMRVLDLYDERYVTILNQDADLRLFSVDPSSLLDGVIKRMGSAVFFSATLRPIQHFQAALGGRAGDTALQLASPFLNENLRVLLHDGIPTRLRARASGYEQIADCIAALAGARTGNYLVYFPSYEYLREVREIFEKRYPGVSIATQCAGMSEPEREEFVAQFQAGNANTLVGFAVLGGIFGEGIDLVGERLIGVVVVGVGLPQICLERDLIREYIQQTGASGFDHAYAIPGMNRVLQAAGRLIRSESDRGVVLLIDERFRQLPYRQLLPAWWRPHRVASSQEISHSVAAFWAKSPGASGRIPPVPDNAQLATD